MRAFRNRRGRALASGLLLAVAPGLVAQAAERSRSPYGAYGGWDDANCSRNDEEVWTCAPPKTFSGAVVAPAGDKVRVWMSFWGATSGCEFDGVGPFDGKTVVAQSTAEGDLDCRVTVIFEGGKVSTSGDPNACGCGGWINTKDLPRVSPDAAIPPVEPAGGGAK